MKKRIILYLLISFLFQINTQAQCEAEDEAKILLVGDSWAFFMSADLTFNTVFERWGHTEYKFITTINLAENGAETDDFLETDKQEEIQFIIENTPSIKAVHLSIGGNDFLGDWDVDMSIEEVDSLKTAVFDRLISVVEFIKQTRLGMTVVLSGYTYPNFEEVIEDSSPFQELHPFYDRWESMGFPSFLEINTLLNEVTVMMEDYAAADPQIAFVNAVGILQNTFGQESPLGVPPGGSYAPGTTAMPYGIIDMPSPKNSMRDYELTKDCFHLSARGYRDMIDYQTQKFYHKFLMDDQYILAENAEYNGSISSENAISSDLLLGEMNGESFSTVLTFQTLTIPTSAIIEKAQIFLRVENIDGNTPLGSQLNVKVKSGSFGDSFNIEIGDGEAEADADELSCRYGSNDNEGRWIRLDLPYNIFSSITADAPTQFMISANDASGGLVTFTGIDDPEFTPVLNLKFDPSSVTSVVDVADWTSEINIFPNPTNGELNIDISNIPSNKKLRIEIFDVLGNSITQQKINNDNTIHAVNLKSLKLAGGTYFIRVDDNDGIYEDYKIIYLGN